jgi:hypothetical protein
MIESWYRTLHGLRNFDGSDERVEPVLWVLCEWKWKWRKKILWCQYPSHLSRLDNAAKNASSLLYNPTPQCKPDNRLTNKRKNLHFLTILNSNLPRIRNPNFSQFRLRRFRKRLIPTPTPISVSRTITPLQIHHADPLNRNNRLPFAIAILAQIITIATPHQILIASPPIFSALNDPAIS